MRTEAEAHGQGHVFKYWDMLTDFEKEGLLQDLEVGSFSNPLVPWGKKP